MDNHAEETKGTGTLPTKQKCSIYISDHMQSTFLSCKIPEVISRRSILFHKGVSTISNTCTYNLLAWKRIAEKFDIKWMYLLNFIFVDTAFLLCGAELTACLLIFDIWELKVGHTPSGRSALKEWFWFVLYNDLINYFIVCFEHQCNIVRAF